MKFIYFEYAEIIAKYIVFYFETSNDGDCNGKKNSSSEKNVYNVGDLIHMINTVKRALVVDTMTYVSLCKVCVITGIQIILVQK